MDSGAHCLCCLTRPPDFDFRRSSPQSSDFKKTEVYVEMLKECFEINISSETKEVCRGICSTCIARLRDALDFKQQVIRCQEELQTRSIVKEEKPSPDVDVKEELLKQDDDFDICFYDDTITEILNLESGKMKRKSERNSKEKRLKEKSDRKTRTSAKKLLKLPISIKSTPPAETIKEHMKFKLNIQNILQYSNCTPFLNKTIAGITCVYCRKSYNSIDLLSSHCKEKHQRSLDEIKKYYTDTVSIKMDINNLECNICHVKINLIADLKDHLTKEHGIHFYSDVHDYILEFKLTDSDIFNCVLCYSTFETFKMLLQHMNGHYRNFICEVCNMGFINKHRLKNHKRTHDIGTYNCSYCDKVFETKTRMLCHEKYTHNKSTRYKTNCPHCEKSFTSYYQRNSHMKTEHNVSAATYKCNICDVSFIMKSKLTTHIKKVHLMERNHTCPECGQGFFIKQSLDEHMVKHSGEKVFKCTVCLKAYARKKTLVEHMRIHNNDRRFKCSVCGLAFVQKCSMKSHMLSNHGVSLQQLQNG